VWCREDAAEDIRGGAVNSTRKYWRVVRHAKRRRKIVENNRIDGKLNKKVKKI
jgi:hypothetical protein